MEKQQSTVAVFAEETEIPAVRSKKPSKTLQLKQVLRAKGPVVIYLPGRSVSPYISYSSLWFFFFEVISTCYVNCSLCLSDNFTSSSSFFKLRLLFQKKIYIICHLW